MMNLNEINAQLEKNGQQHLLAYYDQLDEKAKDSLLEQIAHTDLSIVNQIKNKQNLNQKGKFSPLEAMELDEIEQNKAEFEKIGLDAIRQGKVAAVLLA